MRTQSGLSAGTLVGDRYLVERELDSDGAPTFAGRDEDTGRPIRLTQVSRGHANALRPGLNLEHAHLARLLAIVEHEGVTLAVSEAVTGETLGDRMRRGAPLEHVAAVRAALRVADAITEMHHAGAVHGLIHPSTVVIESESRATPVVTFGPIQNGPVLRWPGSGEHDVPTERDDTFQVAALLFEMLVGRVPDPDGLTDKGEIERLVEDPELGLALWHALTHDEAQRSKELKPLQRELARWFVDHPGEKLQHHSAPPPPLPGAAPPAPAVPRVISAPPPRRAPRWLLPLALIAVLLGLSAAWAFSRGKRVEVVEVAAPAATSSAPATQQAAIDLGEIPVTGREQIDGSTVDKLASCVAGFLPKDSFLRSPDVSFLCTESNAADGAIKLRVAAVSGGRGQTTDAMRLFSKIGWYDMPVWAVIRAGCCEAAPPVTAPDPAPKCDRLDTVLQEIGAAALASRNLDDLLARYTAATRCEFNAGRVGVYHQKGSPQPFEEGVFRDFVKTVQTP